MKKVIEEKSLEQCIEELNTQSSIRKNFYNRDDIKLNHEIKEFVLQIKEYNKSIDDIQEQIIITTPYYYWELIDYSHYYAAEIGVYKVKDTEGILTLFTTWDNAVLNK